MYTLYKDSYRTTTREMMMLHFYGRPLVVFLYYSYGTLGLELIYWTDFSHELHTDFLPHTGTTNNLEFTFYLWLMAKDNIFELSIQNKHIFSAWCPHHYMKSNRGLFLWVHLSGTLRRGDYMHNKIQNTYIFHLHIITHYIWLL